MVGESIQRCWQLTFSTLYTGKGRIMFLFEMQKSNKIFYEPQYYDGNHTY